MKKIAIVLTILLFALSCSKSEEQVYTNELILRGFSDAEGRTAFGTPDEGKIPFYWSAGDKMWAGDVASDAIAEDCIQATFRWTDAPTAESGCYHLFYNMTGSANSAKVLAEQSADGNLGNDGDFGYALADEFEIFVLEHKTAYIWFDTTSDETLPKLTKITVTAAEGIALAGQQVFDYQNDEWSATVANGTNSVVLDFGEGVELCTKNEEVFATMVVLPAAIGGTELTVVYTFADGSTFTEVKNPQKDLVAGKTQRVATTICSDELVQPLGYELRVLTFEDDDTKFEPYECEFVYWGTSEYKYVDKWSSYIPTDGQYGNGHRTYEWCDSGNTELAFVAPEDDSFWGIAGHAGISNFVGSDYQNEGNYMYDLQAYNVAGGANGSINFCTQYGYLDPDEYATEFSPNGVLPGLQFHDEVARVIEYMYVTNTTYAYKVLVSGECDFGGSYQYTDDSTFKIVAYGYDSFEDTEPTQTEFFLLNTGKRMVTEWTKWDLTPLGAVVRVEFNLVACDNGYGKYGNVIPAYFAYDDVAVRFER